MAYSNWGAFVYKDGERRTDKEDVGVWDTEEACVPTGLRIFANILKNRVRENDDWCNHSHHAVLGDGKVRLCGYKCYPYLYIWVNGKSEAISTRYEYGKCTYEDDIPIEVDGETWFYSYDTGDNSVELTLVEPDGSVWTSECGYMIGAGFEDEY